MKNLEKLSIVIVNYNGGDFLIQCLSSLEKASDEVLMDIWVVDNASSDNSIKEAKKKFPKNNYILNEDNLGFGNTNNIQDVGAATCKVEKLNGSIDFASHRGFPTPWAAFLYFILQDDSLYHLTNNDLEKSHEVDGIAGAFFLTRKSVLGKVGLFDEDYWLYAEDLDLCFRIKEAGFKIMYVPSVKIIHHKGVSSGIKRHSAEITTATVESRRRAFDSFYETMKIFYKKHLEERYPF